MESTVSSPKTTQNNSTPKLGRLEYIDGLRGLACLFIMFNHFFFVYKYANDPLVFQSGFWEKFLHFPLKYIVNGDIWFFLFFIISGFLLGKSKPASFKTVIVKTVNRFFRLFFPIMGAYLIIVIIGKTIGYHNCETVELFQSDWFQSFYRTPAQWTDILITPFEVIFKGSKHLNNPYWVIRDMFFSSVYIYICGYLRKLSADKLKPVAAEIIAAVIAAASLIVSILYFGNVAAACVTGMVLAWYNERIDRLVTSKALCAVLMLFSIAMPMGLSAVLANLTGFDRIADMRFMIIFGSILVLFLPRFDFLKKLFSLNISKFFGKISFGIYSLHWPLFCSLGSLILINLWGVISRGAALAVTYAILIVISIAAGYLYNIAIEKPVGKLQDKIMGLIKKI